MKLEVSLSLGNSASVFEILCSVYKYFAVRVVLHNYSYIHLSFRKEFLIIPNMYLVYLTRVSHFE